MTDKHQTDPTSEARESTSEPIRFKLDRRDFVKAGVGGLAAMAAAGTVLEPLRAMTDAPGMEALLRKHYEELTPKMMEEILARVEAQIARDHGVRVNVEDDIAIEGVEFAYALNLSRCNGSRRCVEACMQENNIPPDRPDMAYIRVLELDNTSLDLEDANVRYDHETVPQKGKFYLPASCQQCRDSPCTKVCPCRATWRGDDGIRLIDYNWCIGCRYCMAACPYGARRFNWSGPKIEPERINPDMGYLSNRIRPRGVVEKCSFCLHRVRRGKNPACMEVCPTGARVFGNLLDPNGKIRYILENKRVFILKADLRTHPRFYYFFDK